MSYFNKVQTVPADSPFIDAFGRQRVSQPVTLFDGKLLHDAMPLAWDDQQISGTATSTYNANQASITLAVNNTTAGRRIRRTFQHFNYQPGKSILVLMSAILGAGAAGITKRLGLGDNEDGLFFESVDGVYGVNVRTNTSGTPAEGFVAQADWNLDKLDGTGPSGKTVDFTKAQIFVIDYEWLGVGRVRFGIVTNGGITYVHQFTHFNQLTTVYMSLPNLPLQYEIINDGSGPANSMTGICSTVMSEGTGQDGMLRAVNGTVVTTLAAGTTYALIGLRLKSTNHAAGIEFVNASWVATDPAAQVFQTSLRLNPTVTSEPSFTGLTGSPIEYYLGTATHTVTGGTTLIGGVTNAQQLFQIARSEVVRFGTSIAGVNDRLVVCVTPISNNMSVAASISWKELN